MVLMMPQLEGKWSQTLQPAKSQYILNLTHPALHGGDLAGRG